MELPFNVVDVPVRVVVMFRKNDFDDLPDISVVIRDTREYDVDEEVDKMREGGWDIYADSHDGINNERRKESEPGKGDRSR